MNSVFVKHSPCPNCGSRDNVGVYSDGAEYCFGCGYLKRTAPTINQIFKSVVQEVNPLKLFIPDDITSVIPPVGLQWLYQYELTTQEIEENGIRWSNYLGGLVLLVQSFEKGIIGYQVRSFRKGGRKYITYGSSVSMCKELLRQVPQREILILVEDRISAIKINRQASAVAVLGSKIPPELLRTASERFNKFLLWYDPDKRKEAIQQCYKARQAGFEIYPVFSDVDPKELSDEQLGRKIANCW